MPKRKSTAAWTKKLWAVEMSSTNDGHTMLLGSMWWDGAEVPYPGAPTRALLFTVKKDALAYCKAKHLEYRKYPDSHVCLSWRFRPVRVVESVHVI